MTQTAEMTDVAKDLQAALDRIGWNQSQFAREILRRNGAGISRVTINRILSGETEDPHDGTVSLLFRTIAEIEAETDAGGLPVGSDFDPRAQPSLSRTGWIPMIGRIAAGKATDFEHELATDKSLPPSLYNVPSEYPAALIAQGDSMAPLIDDGDVVVIARKFWREPQTGDIVAVTKVQEGGHTIKHLEVLKDGRWILQPHNLHKHRPETLELGQVKAAAVVVGWYHPVHRPRGKK